LRAICLSLSQSFRFMRRVLRTREEKEGTPTEEARILAEAIKARQQPLPAPDAAGIASE